MSKPKVVFTEENHKYTFTEHPEISLISGTKFVGYFEEGFKKDIWLPIKAAQEIIPNYPALKNHWESRNLPVESEQYVQFLMLNCDLELLEEAMKRIESTWNKKSEKSSVDGTEYHLNKELASYKRGVEKNPYDGKTYPVIQRPPIEGIDNYTMCENLFDLEDGYYPELLVYWDRLVGQADRLWIGTDKFGRYADCGDFKTYEKLTKRGFYDRKTRTYKTFKSPINHVEDCKLNKTGLQTSTYLWCLEQWGFQPRYNGFNHFETLYTLPYYRKEVELMYKSFPWEEV